MTYHNFAYCKRSIHYTACGALVAVRYLDCQTVQMCKLTKSSLFLHKARAIFLQQRSNLNQNSLLVRHEADSHFSRENNEKVSDLLILRKRQISRWNPRKFQLRSSVKKKGNHDLHVYWFVLEVKFLPYSQVRNIWVAALPWGSNSIVNFYPWSPLPFVYFSWLLSNAGPHCRLIIVI